jgi:hypothetical protein
VADPSPSDADQGQEPAVGEGQEPSGDATPDSQDEKGRTYSEAYVKQLRRESAGLRTRLGEVEERLQVREDADKTEHERLAERASTAETRAQEAELRLLRHEIAAERKLEPAAVQFLTGSTREEIELRAEELAKLITEKPSRAAAGFDGGARMPAPDTATPEQAHNDLLLRALGRQSRPRVS